MKRKFSPLKSKIFAINVYEFFCCAFLMAKKIVGEKLAYLGPA
jgi:hypothetical protein